MPLVSWSLALSDVSEHWPGRGRANLFGDRDADLWARGRDGGAC